MRDKPDRTLYPDKRNLARSGFSGVVALGLLVSACGSGSTSSSELGAASESRQSGGDSAPTSDGSSESSTASTGQDAEGQAEGQEDTVGPTAPTEHLFPSIDVVSVHTGETMNLADELAGGDRPVLLWFWAPH